MALGGHVAACEDCTHTHIAYNSCRNRHCPKCQGGVAKAWLAARQAELLPVAYYHVVFTLPAPIGDIAYYNKAVIYAILFKAAAETLITIARDPKHQACPCESGGRPHRPDRRAAHMEFGTDPSSAPAWHRAGRWHLTR